MSGDSTPLEGHLRRPAPAGGHGYDADDLAESVAKFSGDLRALHAEDHRSTAQWARRLQQLHTHAEVVEP
jgi:hypothetical protein